MKYRRGEDVPIQFNSVKWNLIIHIPKIPLFIFDWKWPPKELKHRSSSLIFITKSVSRKLLLLSWIKLNKIFFSFLISHAGISCITCSYKAGSGMLYPLERGFIFVHKPPVHVRFDEISSVNFARVQGGGGSSRSFDFEVETKSGATYVFSSIEKLVLA